MTFDESHPPSPVRYSYASSTIGLAIALPIIDLIVVALRFLARRKQRLHIGPDDWLSIGALVGVTHLAVFTISERSTGLHMGLRHLHICRSVRESSYALHDADHSHQASEVAHLVIRCQNYPWLRRMLF